MFLLATGMIGALLAQPAPDARLEACFALPAPATDATCAALLEQEAALAPDGLFNARHETSPGRLEGWLGAVCADDRLEPGQTGDACLVDAQARLERSRAARLAMAQEPGRSATGGPPRRLGYSVTGDAPAYAAPGSPATRPQDEERCERREATWRDEDTGDSESSYSVRCFWGSGDPETREAAERALDEVLGGD